MSNLDNLIATITAAIDEEESHWMPQEFTESRDSVEGYAGVYEFNTEATQLAIVAVPLDGDEIPLIAPGFGDL